MVILIYENDIFYVDGKKTRPISKELCEFWANTGITVFVYSDDEMCSIYIKYFKKYNTAVTIKAHKLQLYSIQYKKLIIKCWSQFIPTNTPISTVKLHLQALDKLTKSYVYKSICTDELLSVSGISQTIINMFWPDVYNTSDTKLNPFFRHWHFGGRIEVVVAGDFPHAWRFDFPGLYSTILTEELSYNYEECTINVHNTRCFREVQFQGINLMKLPIRVNNTVTYALQGVGIYHDDELDAFKCGGGIIIKEFRCWMPMKTAKLLAPICESLQIERKYGNIAAKQILNAIYGRLGIREQNTITKIVNRQEYAHLLINNSSQIQRIKDMSNGLFLIEYLTTPTPTKANIPLAAAITARGRAKLLTLIHALQQTDCQIKYINTDEVIITGNPPTQYDFKPIIKCNIKNGRQVTWYPTNIHTL